MESFCENNTFCFYKRVTGAGLSNLVARTLVIFSPLVAELEGAYPDIVVCGIILLALILAFFLPDRAGEDEYTFEEGTGLSFNFPTSLGDLKAKALEEKDKAKAKAEAEAAEAAEKAKRE